MDFGLGEEPIRDSAGSRPRSPSLVTSHSTLLFIYGTLRRGFSRHKFLKTAGAEFVSPGVVRGDLYDLGEFPGAIPTDKSAASITGEVFRLPSPSRALKVLDDVEGIVQTSLDSSPYRRALAGVALENGTKVEAWIYWLNRWHGPKRRIPSGDYAKYSGLHD